MKMNERLLRDWIRGQLLKEAIVSYQGVEYDIPDEEAAIIKKKLEFGEADPTPENSRVFDAADEKISDRVKEVFGGEIGDRVWDTLSRFLPKSRNRAIKIILNNKETFRNNVFSVAPSLGLEGIVPDEAWHSVLNLEQTLLGKGEIALALLFEGVTPDGGGGTHDLNIAGIGEVHVKNSPGKLSNPDVRMGKSVTAADQTNWYKSLKNGAGWDALELNDYIVKDSGKEILDSWAKLSGQEELIASADESQYGVWADEWQQDFKDAFFTSVSWGNAAALLLVDSKTGGYAIHAPTDVWPNRISQGGWKGGLKDKKEFRFSKALKQGIKGALTESQFSESIMLSDLVQEILLEELTKSDKKAIEKIAKKQAMAHFDSQIAKAIDKELGKSYFGTKGKISKHVDDAVSSRFKNADKDKDFDDAVIRISKRVLKALHDMHYKRTNLIDRMPVPKK